MADFESDYFIQTRREIDTEKVERNKLLHLMIVVFGGAYALLVNGLFSCLDKAAHITHFSVCVGSFSFSLPLLIFVSSMTKARLVRKFQIADRWEALYCMLRRNKDLKTLSVESSLEAKVIQGLRGTRYVAEDKAIFTAMSIMIYFPMNAILVNVLTTTRDPKPLAVGILTCLLHFLISWRWLFSRPLLPAETGEKLESNKAL